MECCICTEFDVQYKNDALINSNSYEAKHSKILGILFCIKQSIHTQLQLHLQQCDTIYSGNIDFSMPTAWAI